MTDGVEKHDKMLPSKLKSASGSPGSKPLWTSSAKTSVGTAVSLESRVWFTIGQGAIDEIYFPDVDKANTRRIRFLVSDGEQFFSDELADAEHTSEQIAEGVPGYRLTSKCKQGRYLLHKEVITESVRNTLLLHVTFQILDGSALKLYVMIEPHLGDQGAKNSAWIAEYKGLRMLAAHRDQAALAAYASIPLGSAVAGFADKNDGYAQLKKHFKFTDEYNIAEHGNVTLCGELKCDAGAPFVLAIAFGATPAEAAQQARAGVLANYNDSRHHFITGWEKVQSELRAMRAPEGSAHEMYRISTGVMRTHESKRFPGGFVASLSLPWGFARGDKDAGAYHVLWPRDLCETAMGLMACGDSGAGRRALFYLACTQECDGSWSQNMWLDGTKHWGAIQMDGIAMPILMADQLRREDNLDGYDAWPMIRQACDFLLKMGPTTGQDRWEALPGYASFTMACEVAALLAAADFADGAGAYKEAKFLRSTADAWNDSIDTFLYAKDTELAKKYGVDGYYLRITPDKIIEDPDLAGLWVHLANHVALGGLHKVVNVVSPDALALTRFGLRAADDPRMIATAKVIDSELKKELTTGDGWIRSTDDGYGEHADGSPYNGHGIGRCWPLLAGERGHFEVAAGRTDAATEMLRAMSRQTSPCGMLPEQIWDAEDIPEHRLFNGKPAGSGMPLAWAHAEYVKLLRSVEEGKVYDTPPQPVERYQRQQKTADFEIWTENAPRSWISAGKNLRMDFNDAASVSWTVDDGAEHEASTADVVLGRHSLRLDLPESWKTLSIVKKGDGTKLKLRCHQPAE